MLRYTPLILLLTLGCTHLRPEQHTDALLHERCTPTLQEILDIQALRSDLNKEMRERFIKARSGKLSRSEIRALRETWSKRESELKAQVSALYMWAYASGCL